MPVEALSVLEHSLRKEIALVLSMIGAALGLVGLVATGWAKPDMNKDMNPIREVGLWKYCKWIDPEDTTPQDCFSISEVDVPGWFQATQILCVLGFVLQTVTLTLTLVSECVTRCRNNLPLVFAFVGTGFICTVFAGSALIIFCSHVEEVTFVTSGTIESNSSTEFTFKISWAFILTGISAGIQPISAMLGIWDASSKHNQRIKPRKPREEVTSENSPREYPYGSMTS